MTALSERKLSPPVLIAAGAFISLAGVPFIWGLVQENDTVRQTVYIGPEIGDASNPFLGKMVTDQKTTCRVDKTDDGKAIKITPINNDVDKQKWLSEQRDRPPTLAIVVNNSDIPLSTLIQNETVIFTAAMDQEARQIFAAQEKMRVMRAPIRYVQAGAPMILGLGIVGIGVAQFARGRGR